MELLQKALHGLDEYKKLKQSVKKNQCVALTGTGQISRSHMIATLIGDTKRPVAVVCQDDTAAKRTALELAAFLGEEPPIFPTRDLTLYDVAVVSRSWEQTRLRMLYNMAAGTSPIQIFSLESLSLRTMPRDVLWQSVITLRSGASMSLDELTRNLARSGYSRSSLVEGVGQFALRGGILDVFSPAYNQPLRVEFFGDELDAMGFFDILTQRRTENIA